MRVGKSRIGFTLVELLVAAAIVALLLGLLLGGIQKVRVAAARAQSLNKVRGIGLAVQNYESAHAALPGLAEPQNSPAPVADRFNASLFFVILPHVEGGNLARTGAARRSAYDDVSGRAVAPYHVPADDTAPNGLAPAGGAGNFAANLTLFGKVASGPSLEYRLATYNARRRLAGGIPDGASNTVAFVEKRAACGAGGSLWAETDHAAVNGMPQAPVAWADDPSGSNRLPNMAVYSFQKWDFLWYLHGGVGTPPASGLVWLDGTDPGPRTPQDRPSGERCAPIVPQGLTPGGAVAGFADGSGHFVRRSIDFATWFFLTVPDDGKSAAIP